MADILVVIVTYNAQKWVKKCFRSLEESSIKPDVLVIDNGSTDETLPMIRAGYPSVRIIETGENREGMFYAARTFSMTLGQSLAMILFSSIATIGSGGFGYRVTAVVATLFCLMGGLVFLRYRERRVLDVIGARSVSDEEA